MRVESNTIRTVAMIEVEKLGAGGQLALQVDVTQQGHPATMMPGAVTVTCCHIVMIHQ